MLRANPLKFWGLRAYSTAARYYRDSGCLCVRYSSRYRTTTHTDTANLYDAAQFGQLIQQQLQGVCLTKVRLTGWRTEKDFRRAPRFQLFYIVAHLLD